MVETLAQLVHRMQAMVEIRLQDDELKGCGGQALSGQQKHLCKIRRLQVEVKGGSKIQENAGKSEHLRSKSAGLRKDLLVVVYITSTLNQKEFRNPQIDPR